MSEPNSIKSLLKQASEQLNTISDSAYLDAELLIAHSIDKNRTYLHTWPEYELTQPQLENFNKLIDKRSTDYPVAYLLGKKEFWSLMLTVTPDVLIPRPETELLVEIALDKIKEVQKPKILDLGTGSGAIALALASERPDAIITATDYSKKALKVAKQNAVDLNLYKRIAFITSNWFKDLKSLETQYDLIVSNPPYIDPEDTHLQDSIRYEPQQALVAENHGMSDIKKIIQKSHLFLKTGGWLILEHGYNQTELVASLLKTNQYSEIKNILDLNKNPRLTLGLINKLSIIK